MCSIFQYPTDDILNSGLVYSASLQKNDWILLLKLQTSYWFISKILECYSHAAGKNFKFCQLHGNLPIQKSLITRLDINASLVSVSTYRDATLKRDWYWSLITRLHIMILDTRGKLKIFEIRYQYQSLFSIKYRYLDTETSVILVSSISYF